MIAGRIRKAGNSYVVVISPREMAERGLRAGQLVGFEPVPLELRPAAPPRLASDEEADTAGDLAHEQARRDWDERLRQDVAAGLVTQAEIARAQEELEQGAPWAQSL